MESTLLFELSAMFLFIFILGIVLYYHRKKLVIQKLLFPVFYMIMLRTNLGITLMDKIAHKYRAWVKLFGYCSIGICFAGMVYVSLGVLFFIGSLIIKPELEQPGVSLVLPFTNIPGIGYLSFTHWIIAIFVLAVIHEFSHGVVARAHNIKVTSTGFAVFSVFLPLIPAAFVEPEEEVLRKEQDVVQYSVYAAGPMANLALALLIVILFPFAGDPTHATLAPFENSISYPHGFSFEVLNDTYPAKQAGIDNSILLAINDKDVKDYSDFYTAMLTIRPQDKVVLATDRGVYTLNAAASPSNPERGFLGIKPLQNERKIYDDKAVVAPVYYWFRGLIQWLFLLNFFIGLANLLPLGIVDGGRMLETALHSLFDNKHKARKIWSVIGLIFVSTLLFALLVNYLGNPFSLF